MEWHLLLCVCVVAAAAWAMRHWLDEHGAQKRMRGWTPPGDTESVPVTVGGPAPRAGHDAKPMPRSSADVEPPREP